MKRVKMIVTNRFNPDVRVYKEAKYLVHKGFDVEILCWDRENEYIDKENEEIEGIKIKRFFPYSIYGTGYRQIIPYIKFLRECKNYLRDKKYDYLHCYDLDGVIAGYFIKNENVKLIFDMKEFYEGLVSSRIKKYIIRILVTYMQSKSDFIIYVNEMRKSLVKSKNIKKLIFLPNYPDVEMYRECKKIKSKKLRISYIGNTRQYTELKNLMDVCKDIDDVEVYIHGNGIAYKKLINIKSNYSNSHIKGAYHFSESPKLYGQTDILYALYPMDNIQNRTFKPVKLYEAIVTLTPIIVNRGSVLGNFVQSNDIGFVINGDDIEELKELIYYINDNRYILDSKIKNLRKIQFKYSWEEVVKNLDQIYVI